MSRLALWLVAAVAGMIFVAVTVAVTSGARLGLDAGAFRIAAHVRVPALDRAARVATLFGLVAIVGPAVAAGAAVLLRFGEVARAAGLVAGAAISWAGVWVTKALVDRPRPPHPLVHTAGQSYPSAHAANSVGWVALALALAVVIPARGIRVAAVILAVALTALVGLSRIYLRAHYLSDVIGGEALAVSVYALAALGTRRSTAARRRRRPPRFPRA